jgi:hypothetical protein
MKKVGRNDPCPCGSGKKFKKCCESKLLGKKFQVSKIDNPDKPKGFSSISSVFNQFKNEGGLSHSTIKKIIPSRPPENKETDSETEKKDTDSENKSPSENKDIDDK